MAKKKRKAIRERVVATLTAEVLLVDDGDLISMHIRPQKYCGREHSLPLARHLNGDVRSYAFERLADLLESLAPRSLTLQPLPLHQQLTFDLIGQNGCHDPSEAIGKALGKEFSLIKFGQKYCGLKLEEERSDGETNTGDSGEAGTCSCR